MRMVSEEIGREYKPEGWQPTNDEAFFLLQDEDGRWYEPINGWREATPEESRELAHEEWINTPDSVKRELGLIW